MPSFGDSVHFRIRQFFVVEGIDEVSECRVHDSLVVESVENMVQNTDRVGSATNHAWCTDRGEKTLERICVFDACGVIEAEDSNDFSWIQTDTRLFDELNNAALRGCQLHVNLHDLSHVPSGSGSHVERKSLTSISA